MSRPARQPQKITRSFREKLVWPGIVFGLIATSMTLMTITLTLAVSDPSFGVEEDYYAKAVAWDETAELRASSDALGWSADVSISDVVDGKGERSVTVLLTDAEGLPVDASPTKAVVFHHARRTETFELRLVRIAPGRFAAGAPLTREGLWQVRLRFEADNDVFLITTDVDTDIESSGAR